MHLLHGLWDPQPRTQPCLQLPIFATRPAFGAPWLREVLAPGDIEDSYLWSLCSAPLAATSILSVAPDGGPRTTEATLGLEFPPD